MGALKVQCIPSIHPSFLLYTAGWLAVDGALRTAITLCGLHRMMRCLVCESGVLKSAKKWMVEREMSYFFLSLLLLLNM